MKYIEMIIILFISNSYIIDKGFNFKIPLLLTLLLFFIINLFPSIGSKKLESWSLKNIRNGYILLEIFLMSTILSIIFGLSYIFYFHIDYKIILINILIVTILLIILFWNGIIRIYLFSKQLGIKYRIIGICVGMIPIINLIVLIKMISITKKEVAFENDKIILNKSREKEQICKTKYPILLVHGVFFRDYKFIDYWGRIPKELKRNGATIYYGNHSSALPVNESAKELTERVKQIIDETNCEKVNIIAHSKGGLDCRYAISECGMAKYVASLTMVSTPNHGCEFVDYLLEKCPRSLLENVSSKYNATLKRFGDNNPDFEKAVRDLTSQSCEEINNKIKKVDGIFYQSYGSKLIKSNSARFPLNLTTGFVKTFDGDNDGLVGEKSFQYGDKYEFIIPKTNRGISHGDTIDLNHENIEGFDVREFYVKIVSDLKNRGL